MLAEMIENWKYLMRSICSVPFTSSTFFYFNRQEISGTFYGD